MSLCALCKTPEAPLSVLNRKLLKFLNIKHKKFKDDDQFCGNCKNKIRRTYEKFWERYKEKKTDTKVQYSTTNSSEDSIIQQASEISSSSSNTSNLNEPLGTQSSVESLLRPIASKILSSSSHTSNLNESLGTQSTVESLLRPIAPAIFDIRSISQVSHVSVIDTQMPTTSGNVPGGNKRKRGHPELQTIEDMPQSSSISSMDSVVEPIRRIPQQKKAKNDREAGATPGPSNLANVQPYPRRLTSAAVAHVDERNVPIYRRSISGG